MADSFFGFDTTLPQDEDLGSLDRELSEDEYDALNDETFTHAVRDDWEDGHENLVRSQRKGTINDKLEDSEEEYDSDLDINFITRKLEDYEIRNDETDVRNQFQLDPSVWTNPIKPVTPHKVPNAYNNKFNEHDHPMGSRKFPPPGIAPPPSLAQQTNVLQQFIGGAPSSPHPKIMSLEEIERNLINQQQIQQHQKMMQEKLAAIQSKVGQQQSNVTSPNQLQPPPQQQQQQHQQPPNVQQQQLRKIMTNQMPGQPQPQQSPGLMFPPHMNMNGPPPPAGFPPIPPHLQGPNLSKFNPLMNMANHPMNINNFHPNFGPMPMRPGVQLPPPMNRLPPHLMNMQGNTLMYQNLNTETPYFDDYYYTMYKERQRLRGIENESQAHRDNQLNHPFTQPKGHAQMLLRQFNNIGKNGLQNQKNGMGRERRSSESSQKNNEKEAPTPRTYTPLQFENSLGKLQCGSVTAPRKIIDMEIVGTGENGGQSSVSELSTQKKSRQILMHIETLYKIVLKLEDLQHPMAISATIIMKEKREKQRQQQEQDSRNDNDENASTKSSISINEAETQSELMIKLLALLCVEKIPGMMAVRKGRNLIKRIMPHIKDQPIRWDIWNAVFISLTVFKRDKLEENESSLMALYYEFALHLQDADLSDLLKVTNNMMTSDKLMSFVNGCKLVVSSIIAMIIKSELLYQKSGDAINFAEEEQWIRFLNKLFEIVNNDRTVDAQILNSANNVHRDKNDNERIIKTVMVHFQRFKARFTSDEEKLVKLLGIQYDVK
ncbi:CLUMA_CG017982, isoform A [Clunio marinus]|uniref:CLUMA_CG017982, isoform A n=1 Tax=Clunio marinus TaxID=568069 RepID=A0A1J1IYN1_9DIPT|nr:CLUMA_CG017982, isoform A [Clunio marinus]